ncbi:oxidoreductase [Streptomyces sp. B6B3]|uniref:oxidoreductase n=1 Tax=Streptomyces sp. B6B3 TaxID=3153570 RepID=UPI00325DFC7C
MSAATPCPLPYRVVRRVAETADTASLVLEPVGTPLPPFAPGQFAEVTMSDIGTLPVPVSAILTGARRLVHTVRAGGAETELYRMRAGMELAVRGPLGTGWQLSGVLGRDLLVVADGMGLAPLRPLVREVFARAPVLGRINVLVGAASPAAVVYADTLRCLGRAAPGHVAVTVDRPDARWRGPVGRVTHLLDGAAFDAPTTTAFVSGPEAMVRATAEELLRRGLPADRIQVSLEHVMRCASESHERTGGRLGCDRCRLVRTALNDAGPVVTYDRARPLLALAER